MNILFTSAGRRNYLINYFKKALKGNGKIMAVDHDLMASALQDADILSWVPKINDKNYIPALKSMIKENSINLVIPLNDLELPLLAKHKSTLESPDTKVIVSEEDTTTMAFDKWLTFQFFEASQIKSPKTYLNIDSALKALKRNEITYPLILKPRWGTGSIAIEWAENEEELFLLHKMLGIKIQRSILKNIGTSDEAIIIQEKICGTEYGVDILNDLDGNHYGSFVKKKLGMRSGETDKAISIIDDRFSALCKYIGTKTKHLGVMDCDFMVTAENEIYFLEMNPRFGGGYPYTHESGVNISAMYLSWAMGQKDVSKFDNYKANMTFSKFDQLIKIKRQVVTPTTVSKE